MKQGRVKGQADLVLVDHVFYLLLVVDLPEPPQGEPVDFLGVDLGVKNTRGARLKFALSSSDHPH
jgi:hypothetical protein